jgi:hypothetical protein
MKPDRGNFLYWSAVVVTFAITICMLFSCFEDSGKKARSGDPNDTAAAGTEVGNPAPKTVAGTEVGNPALMEKNEHSKSSRSGPECMEMLAENLNCETDSLNVFINDFDAITFMKQLP